MNWFEYFDDQVVIWTAENGRVAVTTDSNQFIARIVRGEASETVLSVGFSFPAHAEVPDHEIKFIQSALDALWAKEKKPLRETPVKEMMPLLFALAEEANEAHCKWISKFLDSKRLANLTGQNGGVVEFCETMYFVGTWEQTRMLFYPNVGDGPSEESPFSAIPTEVYCEAADLLKKEEDQLKAWELRSGEYNICTITAINKEDDPHEHEIDPG